MLSSYHFNHKTKMPIPEPRTNEPRNTFIDRCMGDDTMSKEYKTREQRYAVCAAQLGDRARPIKNIWKKKKKK